MYVGLHEYVCIQWRSLEGVLSYMYCGQERRREGLWRGEGVREREGNGGGGVLYEDIS